MSRLKKPFRIEIQKSAVVSSYRAIYVNVSELSARGFTFYYHGLNAVIFMLFYIMSFS